MKNSIISLLLIALISCQAKHDTPTTFDLHHNWQFKKASDSVWKSASVPGNVYADLLDHQLIEHPFIGANEDSLQWISDTDWEYKTSFLMDKETLQKKHIELHFEGIDTYASVFLNDSLIATTNNAFTPFMVDVKSVLKPENELRVLLERTSIFEEEESTKLNYQLPEGYRVFTRKAQFQYGWDWGPKLNTSGIWKPVNIVAWNDFKINDINVKQLSLETDVAELEIDITNKTNLKTPLDYDIYVNDSLCKTYENIDLNYAPILSLSIKNPKRWWPHNLGAPYLYHIKVIVRDHKKILDSISAKKGLRTIELVTEKDNSGESFYFKVNDIPVYMKGANYIPQHSLQNKVTHAHYKKLLNDVVDANMNMLRVWGGGIYEETIFYDLCDEKGILIWQDFMFACAMYPGHKDFLNNVQKEATEQVKRLRNHASIALWCGNNESAEGWKRWGWQDGRSEEEKNEIWQNYLKIFDSILPNTVSKLTHINYWETSPKYGRGHPLYNTEGDAHDWWVWHDGYPFEHFETHVPRFMSEFGFQSFPSYETIQFINQKQAIDITSESFKNHQKHPRGFQIIDNYMTRDFPVPDQAEDYAYVSQLLQAYGITKGIEAHRRAKPYNMGSLYWQLNDCWPAVSWSSIDFFGNWKALHYQAKKSFENVIVSQTVENEILKTYVINDELESYDDVLLIKIIDFEGRLLWTTLDKIHVDSNSSEVKRETKLKNLNLNASEIVIISYFKNNKSLYYLAKPKDLNLKKAPIQQTITKTRNGFKITLKSTTLQKNVFLYTKTKGHFSDNYFDVLPNESVDIEFETEANVMDELMIKSLNNFREGNAEINSK